jgi:hypothetical protein
MSNAAGAVWLSLIDQAFDHPSWHGPNLCSAIRGLTAKHAALRPVQNRHNIWEQVVHAAYWKYVVRRRLTGEKRGSFPVKGSNWFVRPLTGMDEGEWNHDVALLMDMHRGLRAVIADLPVARVHRPLSPRDKRLTPARLISGIALHDVYHAGQIGLLRRMIGAARRGA